MQPNILVTLPKGPVFSTFFDKERICKLEKTGSVEWNDTKEQYTPEELCIKLKDKDICVTGWGSPVLNEQVLKNAGKLLLIAHTGGSVKPYITDTVYEREIKVVSGNKVFAESVAEGVIAYALSALRDIPYHSARLKKGIWPEQFQNRGLLGRSLGIVGYGMIAGYVINMLKPFHNSIKVFSRHISQKDLEQSAAAKADLDEIFSTCDIISIHSGMTPENYHLITEKHLRKMKPGALLINTARGAIIEEAALCRVLKEQDIYAVLDVFETEPLPKQHELLSCERVLLMPHMGGPTIDRRLAVTDSIISDIRNYLAGAPLSCEISRNYAAKMSAY